MLTENPLSLAEYRFSELLQMRVPALAVMVTSYQTLRTRWRAADLFCGSEIERLTREVHALRAENERLKKKRKRRAANESGVYPTLRKVG